MTGKIRYIAYYEDERIYVRYRHRTLIGYCPSFSSVYRIQVGTLMTSSVLLIIPKTGGVDPLGNVDALGQLMDVLRETPCKFYFDKKVILTRYCCTYSIKKNASLVSCIIFHENQNLRCSNPSFL